MNQTITCPTTSIYAAPVTHHVTLPDAKNRDSFMKRIISKITNMAKDFCAIDKSISQHKSFMDENLIDPIVGPEISRTLRR